MEVNLDGKIINFDKKMTVRDLLKQLKLNPETFLVTVNGNLVTPDEQIGINDSVKIIRVVSGG